MLKDIFNIIITIIFFLSCFLPYTCFQTFIIFFLFNNSTKDEIKQHFNCSPKGDLTQHGFIQLYSLQTSAEPEETWRDLKSLGYDEQLKKIN